MSERRGRHFRKFYAFARFFRRDVIMAMIIGSAKFDEFTSQLTCKWKIIRVDPLRHQNPKFTSPNANFCGNCSLRKAKSTLRLGFPSKDCVTLNVKWLYQCPQMKCASRSQHAHHLDERRNLSAPSVKIVDDR